MPSAVAKLGAVRAVASGGFHALALLKNGTLRTWGTPAAAARGLLSIPPVLSGKTIVVIAAAGDCSVVSIKESPGIVQWGSGCDPLKSQYAPPTYGGASNAFTRFAVNGVSADDRKSSGPYTTLAAQRANGVWSVWGAFAGSYSASRATSRSAASSNATIRNIVPFGNA
jgi:hypothetical protein